MNSSNMTDKEQHTFNVGHLMRKLALQLGYSNDFARDMFILGCCHETPVLEFKDYQYITEIMNCKNADCKYNSPALTLLNFAEIHIDERGSLIPTKECLETVEKYYGIDSKEYKKTEALSNRFCTEELEKALQQIDTSYFDTLEITPIVMG